MLQVKLNKSNDNPFYGMQNTLQLFQDSGKGAITEQLLNAAYKECKTSEQREMFYSLLFSIGDITGRQHNIFGKTKVDKGGNANREAFRMIVSWMKRADYKQYLKFLKGRLFNEYNCFDTLLANRIKTKPKTNKIIGKVQSYDVPELDDLADFLATIVHGKSPFDKMLLAKFLTRPRTSKRSKHNMIQPATKEQHILKAALIHKLSQRVEWPVITHGKFQVFDGYYNWRKAYNQDLESVMFSSGKIKEFDQQEFLNWLNKIPASARYRVKRRLFDAKGNINEKWLQFAKWFQIWETSKVEAQSTQRKLEEKVRQGDATEEDKAALVKVKKEAKVTTGAINFVDIFAQIVNGTVDKIKLQPFLDKINLPYNNLVFVDDSGSMTMGRSFGFTPRQFGAFIATICLMKNPDDVARNLIGLFSQTCRMFSSINIQQAAPNSLMKGVSKEVSKPLIVPENHFLDNLKNIEQFIAAHGTGNGTNVASIPDNIFKWINGDTLKLEQIQQYPVWTLISDGNFNQLGNTASSLNDFFARCQKYFGFKPFIIAIDVAPYSAQMAKTFSGIENFMFIPPNPAQIEQLLTNFQDIDIMDVYTPLQSLHRSSRYAPVRGLVK